MGAPAQDPRGEMEVHGSSRTRCDGDCAERDDDEGVEGAEGRGDGEGVTEGCALRGDGRVGQVR